MKLGYGKIIILLFIFFLGAELIAHLAIETLWFQELGYLDIFLTRLGWQLGLALGTTLISGFFLAHHYRQAQSLAGTTQGLGKPEFTKSPLPTLIPSRYLPLPPLKAESPLGRAPVLGLPVLLFLILGINLLIAWVIMQTVQGAIAVWTPDFTLPNLTSAVAIPQADIPNKSLPFDIWLLTGGGFLAALTLWQTQRTVQGLILILSLLWGAFIAGNWTRILKFFHPIFFEQTDPQFGKDISFYIFQVPVFQVLEFWLRGLGLLTLLAVLLIYLCSEQSLSEGKFPGFTKLQLAHLCRLGATFCLILSLGHWLNRFQRLYVHHAVLYGANYTDIHLRLPLDSLLIVLTTAIALGLAWQGWWSMPNQKHSNHLISPVFFYLVYGYLALIFIQLIGGQMVELFVVQPNQLSRESSYIDRSITATRQAFNLDTIQSQTLSGKGKLTQQDLENNQPTLNNVRLWDPLPLLQTNRQLQQIRLYYRFSDADLDRYHITESPPPLTDQKRSNGKDEKNELPLSKETLNQVLIAPRELDYNAVPDKAKTWVNEHLVYTHGYGFTLSPVNLVDQGGLPFYFVKDIGTDTQEDALRTSSEVIRASIPIGKPRIYFGELTDTYIMTNTKVKEFDFPRGEDNVYNVYDGTGGIKLGNLGRRLLFAIYLRDWQMLFTRNFNPDTKILFRRNINQRVRELAPFLRFDRDPYLVTAKTKKGQENTLYWMIDAYTTSNYYPYSDPGERPFNYIRNSVKIVVDAYNGKVNFYVMAAQDPLIQSWQAIFPHLFKPFAAMPAALKEHIRYPVDLFSTQSERLLTYHMTDLAVFYNREDQWQIPKEIYGKTQLAIAPYYLIMKLAGLATQRSEFVLSHVYTPISRSNLIALLFARSDQQNYGKLLLYTLPKEKLVYGPEQIEALINQDPVISERITLWNREGSRVIQGNLLVIPINESLLYVEPLYLEAEQNSLPTLARVVVVYENQIAMAKTLEGALDAIFSPQTPSPTTILRQVQEPAITP
jgi:hypothetical protein